MGSNGKWYRFKLGPVCTKIGSGATPRGGSKVYLDHGEVALLRSQNVYNEGFNRNGLIYINQEHAEQLSNVEVLGGDVLLNITGDSVARCCQVPNDVLPARVNQHVAIIRPDPEKLDSRYLRYFLVSPAMQGQMLSWAGTGGTRNALTKGMIESFEIPAPDDIQEQQAIAHILGSLNDKIELNRQMNETLEAMAHGIFKSWFVDFDPVIDNALRVGNSIPESMRKRAEKRKIALPAPQSEAARQAGDLFPDSFEDSELGEIPKGCRVTTISDFANITSGKRPHKRSKEKRDEFVFPLYGGGGGLWPM